MEYAQSDESDQSAEAIHNALSGSQFLNKFRSELNRLGLKMHQ